MARLAAFNVFVLALIIGLAPVVLAGPACARKLQGNATCVTECGKNWGWTGRTMGTDPWGNVMKVSVTDVTSGSVVTKACKLRPDQATPVGNIASGAPASSATSPPPAPSSTAASLTSTPSKAATSAAPQRSSSATVSTPSPSPTTRSTSTVPPARTEVVEPSSTHHTTSTPPPPPPSSSPPPPPPPPKTTEQAPPPSPPPSPPPATTKAPQPQTTAAQNSVVPSSGSGGTSASDIAAYLAGHNTIRAQHGAAPLTWSDDAAAKAQQWANGCLFQHSGGTLGPFGENLAAGTGPSYDIPTAIKSWTDEVSQYDPTNPVPSHFTQVVWKATTEVGCAVQSCNGIFAASFGEAKYFVCEYSVQGNIIGSFAQNVQV
ncbi:hypothetical protein EUX98_g32 [Antrodiella citrinella]|uniref:SCP domain-containing protein n=1 Tax=Antrodiella citrinella TaxID=2447956 RepID=A0A4S4N6M0_9APHY|nr:hypothetical protein EUX98_g32 [Antrodiella citrinella]